MKIYEIKNVSLTYLCGINRLDMDFESLVNIIRSAKDAFQIQAAHSINLSLTARNWVIGYYVTEFEQHGEDRAQYGAKLLKSLEQRINSRGFTERRFREYRQLYQVYSGFAPVVAQYIASSFPSASYVGIEGESQIRRITAEFYNNTEIRRMSAESDQPWKVPADKLFTRVSYSNLLTLSSIEDPLKRAFYEIENMQGCWTNAELERQIATAYYERSGLSKDKEALAAKVQKQAAKLKPEHIINSPAVFEFLDIPDVSIVDESVLETAILDHLQKFLLEMGHGFCFEARQKRILIDNDYYFIDLVFYHRILKCSIHCELKVDKFRNEYATQLNTYLNYFKNEEMHPGDNPPIGILLCTDKGETLVKYATAGMDPNLFVQKYMIQLPSEDDIKRFISLRTEKL